VFKVVVLAQGPDRVGAEIDGRMSSSDGPVIIDLDWRSPITGGPFTTTQRDRFVLHRGAWQDVAATGTVVVVIEQSVLLEPLWESIVDDTLELMEQSGAELIVLGVDSNGPSCAAYALTSVAAAQLCEAANYGARPMEALLEDVVERVSIAEQAIGRNDPPPSGAVPAARLHVVSSTDDLMALTPEASDELVLLVLGDAAVDVDTTDVVAQAGSQLVVDHGGHGCLGPVVLAQHWVSGGSVVPLPHHELDVVFDDEPPIVDHFVADQPDPRVMALGHRWRNIDAARDMLASTTAARIAMKHGAHEQADDLSRILSYRDAVATGPVRLIDRDLVALALWTPAMCRAVIRAAEAVGQWSSDPDDPVPGNEVSLARISPVLYESLAAHLSGLVLPELHSVWPLVEFGGLVDAFVIRYLPTQQRDLRLHHDIAQLSSAVRLNEDFEGGVLEFPRQQASNESVGIGELLAWPSLVTHPHRSTPVTAGAKYSLTIWWDTPGGRRASSRGGGAGT
jgi:hypothetical protein